MSKMESLIPVYKPLINEHTFKAAHDALENGWLGMGSFVGGFEDAFSRFMNCEGRRCVAVATGTAALHLAMLLAGVGPGDEVITPSLNNIGDFQAIKAVGAEPVFCDILEENLGIDCTSAESMVSEKTRAIIGLHYDGIPCDMDGVFRLAEKHNLRVIEDDCHAIGSYINGKHAGNYGDIACFSFDAVKTITCIDGGMIIVNTEEEVNKLHQYRLIGMSQSHKKLYSNSRSWHYDVFDVGFRYHLANLHAAIGLSQLEQIEVILANRRQYCCYYSEHLRDVEGLTIPMSDFANVGPFMYYVRVHNNLRQECIQYLLERGVETGIHWRPGHQFSFFQNNRRAALPVTEMIGEELLSLPMHSIMPDETLDRVVTCLKSFFASRRAA